MVLVLGIVKTSLEKLGIGIGVKKVVLLMSGTNGSENNGGDGTTFSKILSKLTLFSKILSKFDKISISKVFSKIL